MNSRLRQSLLVLLLAALCLGQADNPLADARVRRVGDNLLCLCGCGNSVTSCNMLHCHYSDPARQRIATLIKEGKSDQEIWEIFARENGKQAILTPPTQGFYLINWITPVVVAGMGLFVVWAVIRRLVRKPAPVEITEVPAEVLDRYHDQIEKEVSKLE